MSHFGKEGKNKEEFGCYGEGEETFLWQFERKRKHCLLRSSICRDAVSATGCSNVRKLYN